MVFTDAQFQIAIRDRIIHELRIAFALAAKCNVNNALTKLIEQIVREALIRFRKNRVVANCTIILHQGWQIVVLHRKCGADTHGTDNGVAAILHSGNTVIKSTQRQANVLVKNLTLRRQADRPARPLKQRYLKLVFQRRDGAGKRRLRNEQLLRSTRVVKHFGKFLEVMKLRYIHIPYPQTNKQPASINDENHHIPL